MLSDLLMRCLKLKSRLKMEFKDYGVTKMNISDVIVREEGKPAYRYKPQEDITGIELAHLLHFFAIAAAAQRTMALYDYGEFLERHKLLRHFEEVL